VPKDEFRCRGDAFDDLLVAADRPRTDKCNICGCKENLETLPCCNVVVCNREADYVEGTWSRDFCNRSHRRNTHCYTHYEVRPAFHARLRFSACGGQRGRCLFCLSR
jgi:hypothetical protein